MIIEFWREKFSPQLYCALINVRNSIQKKKHRIHPAGEFGIYRVTDKQKTLFICRRNRHNRSKRGVIQGIMELAAQYHLDRIETAPGDLLVDCGANIGELGIWARSKKLDYIAFEPETLEARCCDLNVFEGAVNTKRIALWKENAILSFFSKPDTADGSLVEIASFNEVREVEARKLDDFLSKEPRKGKIILKIEAEGAEPEVLVGAIKTLEYVDYIAIDCGYERGKEQHHTFIETNTILAEHGFHPEYARLRHRVTILYSNSKKRQISSPDEKASASNLVQT